MIFTVERSQLGEAVSKLSRIVSSKTSYPVLEGILLSAEQGKVTLIAYNLEMSIKKVIYARTEEDGDIVISAKLLSEIIHRMNQPMIEIVADDKLMCHIRCGSAVFDIMGMSAQDFPELPSFVDGQPLSLKGGDLMEMTAGTAFAVAQMEGTRPILMGINISVENGVLKFVALDGCRVAIKKMPCENADEMNFVLSAKSLNEVIRLIGDKDAVIPILVGYNMISFEVDGYTLISRLMEGEYLNYEKFIPKEYKQRLVLKVGDLIDIIDRISLIINEAFSTPIRCTIKEENIIFSCVTSLGRATETYEADLEGEPFEIGLSPRYLSEALRAIDDDMIQMTFDHSNQGVVIRPLSGDDYFHMILPMLLK